MMLRNEMTVQRPTGGDWRYAWHKTAINGDMIPGKWIAGRVRNFQQDGSWDYQNPPSGIEAGSELEGFFWRAHVH